MNEVLSRTIRTTIIALALSIAAITFYGCSSQNKALRFDTIHQWDYSPKYIEEAPGILIITSVNEATLYEPYFQNYPREKLRNIDFEKDIAVAVFSGWLAMSHEGITIERIVQQENDIFIFASIGEPTGKDTESSPYHLVKIRHFLSYEQVISFNLVADNVVIASRILSQND